MNSQENCLVWFRQDFRLHDNPALGAAAVCGLPVIALFILEEYPHNPWPIGGASRWWLAESLKHFQQDLTKTYGLQLMLRKGNSLEILKGICDKYKVKQVFWGRRYEPFLTEQDKNIKAHLTSGGGNSSFL